LYFNASTCNLMFQVHDSEPLISSMKLLTFTMIDGGDRTIVTCAFIRLLRESVASSTGSKEYRSKVSLL
jgi:hypothetical protein